MKKIVKSICTLSMIVLLTSSLFGRQGDHTDNEGIPGDAEECTTTTVWVLVPMIPFGFIPLPVTVENCG